MKIYAVIDMQNDFITGSLGTKEAIEAHKNAVEFLRTALRPEDKVFFTQDTHYDDYLETPEGRRLPVPHCIYETPGHDIPADIMDTFDVCHSRRFLKEFFGSTLLIKAIINEVESNADVEEIIFLGLCTDICVITNALALKTALCFDDIPVKVIANCCAGVTPEKHEAALEVMKSCQIEVV